MKKVAAILLLLSVLLSGCVYGGEIKQQNAPATGEYISVVQNAVDQFHKLTGVLPIKNKEMDTPIYEKYLIDFKKLTERRLLSEVPTNAFENGGTAIYVLINPETKPEVKLMDLVSYQKMVELQKAVDDYANRHGGQLPEGEPAYPHFYWLDYNKLGQKAVSIISPYSRQSLAVVLHESGQVAIDYAPDIAGLVKRSGSQPAPDKDLRTLLVQASPFVPARTFSYRWEAGQPVMIYP